MHRPSEHDRRAGRQVGITTGGPGVSLLIAAVVAALALSACSSEPPKARAGDPAPPLVGETIDGAHFDLASLKGRPVIVNFWASWCGPCRDETPLLAKEARDHAADGLAIVGVLYKDQPGNAAAFAKEFGATWPTVIDGNGSLAVSYRVVAPPQTYFIDRNGVVKSIQIGEVLPADFDRQYAAIVGS